jgi:hypothetical protein
MLQNSDFVEAKIAADWSCNRQRNAAAITGYGAAPHQAKAEGASLCLACHTDRA